MKSKKWTIQIILLALLMLSVAFFAFKLAYAQNASVWTDKEDYAPEETVTIYGAGFTPHSNVIISLTRPDGHIDEWSVVADESGSFTTTYQLDGIAGTYTVAATDGTNTATTTFTDRTWSVSVSPASATVPQGGSTTATVTVTASPTGGPEVDLWATGQPTGVTVSFSPTKGVPNFSSTMSINVGLTTTPGTYPIDIIVFTGQPGHPSYSEKARTTFTLTVTGIPPATVSITITSSPVTGAGFVKVDGVDITTPATFTWTVGSTHTLEALSPVAGPTGTRYFWISWSDGGDQTHTYTVPSSSETVTANYKTQYYLTVVSPYGTAGGEGWYDEYTHAYATVTPLIVPGPAGVQYVFIGWGGGASGSTSPSDSIYMDGPKTAIANWKTQYYLTVRTDPPGITTILGEGWYDSSQSVQLTAPTVTGYTFNYWDVDGTRVYENSTTVVMNAPRTATAHYSVVPATATVTFSQIGVGSDFTGVVLTVDGVNYGAAAAAAGVTITKNVGDSISFTYHSPLLVGTGKRYVWTNTSGLSMAQSGTITVSNGGGAVTGFYKTQFNITVGQSGVGVDFTGTVVVVDGFSLKVADLPRSYWWYSGSSHSFAFQSPLTIDAAKQYIWISTSGLSAARSGSLVITGSGSIIGNYEVYVPPAQVDLTCQCYVTDGSFKKIGSFTTVFTRVNSATYRLSSTKPNAFYYCIEVTNPGTTDVTGVVLSFQLDPEFIIVGSDPVQVHTGYGRTGSRVSAVVTYNLNSGTVNIASIGAGKALYITISMDYKFKGQTFTRSQALNWVADHPSNTFSCTLQNPVTRQCSATIKDPAEIELQWTGYVQAVTLIGLSLTGLGLAFKLIGHGKRKISKVCIE